MDSSSQSDRCAVEYVAPVNDPETAEEVREELAVVRAQAAALRDEVLRLRDEHALLLAGWERARGLVLQGAVVAVDLASALREAEQAWDAGGAGFAHIPGGEALTAAQQALRQLTGIFDRLNAPEAS